MGNAIYDRDGSDWQSGGLFLEVRLWQAHVFSLTRGS
jgi:hypothetical protein